MPANRKPGWQRQDNRPERSLSVVPSGPVEVVMPSPRRRWRKATKSAWEAFWASDLASAVTDADRAAVERLFHLRDQQVREFERYESEPYLPGSKGQPVQNPAFGAAMALEQRIVALEDRLGLTPKARANLGLAIGQAQLTAEELNRRAKEQARELVSVDEGDVVDAELLEEFQAAD